MSVHVRSQPESHRLRRQAVGDVATQLAKELRNAITAIHGYTQLVLDQLPAGTRAAEDCNALGEAAQRAGAIARQLVALGAHPHGAISCVDLRELLINQRDLLGRLAGPDVVLRCEGDHLPLRAMLDPGDAMDLLTTLVLSARHFLDSRGLIALSADSASGAARLRVTAEAPLETAPRHPAEQARLDELACRYGGNLYCQVAGHRAELTVTLPLHGQVPDSSGEWPAASGTILLVQDDALLCKLTARALTKAGYAVVEAESAEAALDATTASIPALMAVVSDFRLPGISGIELIEQLRSTHRALPAVLTSGLSGALEGHALPSGVQLVYKPYARETIQNALQDALARGKVSA